VDLTPAQVKRLRRRDAAEARTRLAAAERALASLRLSLGAWGDSMRATAELRHGADAANEVLWADPGYSRALNAFGEAESAIAKVAAVKHEFHLAEGAARLHEAPPPAGLT
jgi:hypothetical protein